jgi:L-lactate dehydrogenase
MRVGIIGTGWVGTSVAICLAREGVAREILLNDKRPGLAEGEAMDLSHGAPFLPPVRVRAAEVAEMRDSDALVIAAGRNGRPGESRLDLLRDNAEVVRQLGAQLRGHRGLLLMVTNPVDVLTHVLAEASGAPPERVLGTGTLLDTARMRQLVATELRLSPHSVHLNVVGEHGDSQVPLFSSAWVGSTRLRAWPGWRQEREPALAQKVRDAAGEIIARKGATNHAIGLVTAHLLKWALRDEGRVLCVSRIQDGPLGLSDVALSLPARVDRSGAYTLSEPELDDREREAVLRSAELLKRAKASIAQAPPRR